MSMEGGKLPRIKETTQINETYSSQYPFYLLFFFFFYIFAKIRQSPAGYVFCNLKVT